MCTSTVSCNRSKDIYKIIVYENTNYKISYPMVCTLFLYAFIFLIVTYTRGQNWMPDNRHFKNSELGVTENSRTHLRVTPTGMLHVK